MTKRKPAGVFLLALALCGALFVTVCGATSASQTASKPAPVLMPIDEAGKDASFAAFRARLIRAVRQNDTKAVLAAAHPKILLGFGGDDGKRRFERYWRENQDGYRRELLKVLTNGGAWDRGEKGRPMFAAPYYYARFPEIDGDADIHEQVAILGKNVNIRQAPRKDAPVIARLSYAVVGVTDAPNREWLKIRMADRTEGYVARQFVGSPMGYRAGFEKVGGRWQMKFFLAGD